MSLHLLATIIICLCPKQMDSKVRTDCMEKYVNCAVPYGKDVMKVKEFDNKCNFQSNQQRCYEAD